MQVRVSWVKYGHLSRPQKKWIKNHDIAPVFMVDISPLPLVSLANSVHVKEDLSLVIPSKKGRTLSGMKECLNFDFVSFSLDPRGATIQMSNLRTDLYVETQPGSSSAHPSEGKKCQESREGQ